jgi:acetyl-CoA carboxylase carboxyltransferase component/biotin carboxyl carrier protein
LVHHPKLRADIIASARKMAAAGKYLSLATFEFLVVAPPGPTEGSYYFLECNPRLQVEHTVTEEAYGVDLVATQVLLALGSSLDQVLPPIPPAAPRAALQLRINAEKFLQDGSAVGTTGSLTSFFPPSGPGIRVDTAAHPPLGGRLYKQGLDFDSLLAKIIVVGADYKATVEKARRALEQMRLTGVQTNRALLLALSEDPNVVHNTGISTRYVETNAAPLFQRVQQLEQEWAMETDVTTEDSPEQSTLLPPAGPGQVYIKVHLPGRLISITLKEGSPVKEGEPVAILESMKMEHTVASSVSGTVVKTFAAEGDNLQDADALALIQVGDAGVDAGAAAAAETEVDLEWKPDSLIELEEVRAQLLDDHPVRKKATTRRRAKNFRTARENLDQLVDSGTFVEYGDLVLAAQRTRLFGDDLHATRNDGVIVGWGTVNGGRTAIVMYDFGVLAGSQGYFHHKKLDRIFTSVLQNPAPVVLYAEGGGGRPGDVDLVHQKVAGLHGPSFLLLATINARGIPTIGVANGYLFAGNAALLGTCDFIIATENKGTSIGMGGPAMIEGGGLGVYEPDEVGPVHASHTKNGNVDVVVYDEVEATEVTKQLVSFFQGPLLTRSGVLQPVASKFDSQWYTQDARLLRHAIPVNRKRAYDMHNILALLTDDTTPFFEIGPHWGDSIITGFIRVQGRTVGVMASNVLSPLGGAIDAESARKASRFLGILTKTQCAHVLALCDTPGFMVGPAAEKEGGLRAFAQYFAEGAKFVDTGGRIFGLTVRKAYGLGAQALLGGSSIVPHSSVAWPTGEFAGMGIEGAVKLGMKKELEAIPDLDERAKKEQEFIDDMYRRGRAINMAQAIEIDSVIDPAETRDWLVRSLASVDPRRAFTDQGRQHKL